MKIVDKKNIRYIFMFLCLLSLSCHEDVDTVFPVQHAFTRIPKENVINLVFTGNLDATTANVIQNYTLTTPVKDEIPKIVKITTKGKEVLITLSKPMILYRQYTLKLNNIRGLNGKNIINNIPTLNYNGVDKFEITNTSFNSSKELLINFSSKIDTVTVENSDFKIFSSEKKELKIAKITFDKLKTSLTLNLEAPLTLGKNTLITKGIMGKNNVKLSKTTSSIVFEKFNETKWLKFVNIPLKKVDYDQSIAFDLDKDKVYSPRILELDKEYDITISFNNSEQGIEIITNKDTSSNINDDKGLFVIDKPIEEVKDIAFYTDKLYKKTYVDDRLYNTPFYGNGGAYYRPWCRYDVENIFDYNDYLRYRNAHIIKPLKIIPNQTIVFKTTKGFYGKLEMIGIYKEKPKKYNYKNYTHYITLRVLVQKDGSTNLDIPYNL